MSVRLRRLLSFLLLAVVVAGAAASTRALGDGDGGTPAVGTGAERVAPPVSAGAVRILRDVAAAVEETAVEADGDARRRARKRREAEAAVLRASPTPEAVVRRAWLLRLTDREAYRDQRAVLARARRVAGELGGARGGDLRDALAVVDRLAAAKILTTDRLRPVLLTLHRNTDWFSRRPAPAYGYSVVRGDDPITLRYIPGNGLVLHQLGSWSRVDYLAGSCLRRRVHCPRRKLRSAIETLMALAVRRDGVVRAESYFRFGRASAPWISGMTQGTLVQALTRSSAVLRSKGDRRRARAAMGAFARRAPAGVAVRAAGGGDHYVMYSSAPSLRILNGHLRALTGLRDLATIGGSARAQALFRRGERSARVELRRADTGAWSRYSDRGAEASLGYHRLVTGFLGDLCDRRAGRRYCAAEQRFARYVREPTRVTVRVPSARPRARAGTAFSVWISKVSSVVVTVRDAEGTLVVSRRAQLSRGSRRIAWTPPHPGRYRVTVTAAGPGTPPLGRGAASVVVRRSAAAVARARAKAAARAGARARAQRRAAARARDRRQAQAKTRARAKAKQRADTAAPARPAP